MRGSCVAAAGAIALTLLAGCSLGREETATDPASDALDARLAETFRIDVSELDVTYDFWPRGSRIRGSAVLRFKMRPGQTRPLFHFNPIRHAAGPERAMLRSLELDGEPLDPLDEEDLRRVRPLRSGEPAFEVQRELAPSDAHTLRVSWSIPTRDLRAPAGWFYTDFDDTVGPKNETEAWWPTISSPEEFARHRIHLRVHGDRRYTVLGSGVIRRRDAAGVQAWDLDTERPVASHTVMFAAVPSDQVRTAQFDASGVEVRIVSDRSPAIMKRARAITRRTIARLLDDFGPFPMPSMQILLTGWGGGMEYYGATRTGIGALEHELVHMYFGTATVNRTWRDIWFDEAVVEWWQRRDRLAPLRPGFKSDIVGGRSVVQPGFDEAAYGNGARIFGEIARALGGNREMIAFLADLHRRRAFEPFTTDDFIDDVVAAQSKIDRAELERWLFATR